MNESKPYFYSFEDDERDRVPSPYQRLQGPDGWECTITEPEDKIWTRDLVDVVDKLNEQHEEIKYLQQKINMLYEKINMLYEKEQI